MFTVTSVVCLVTVFFAIHIPFIFLDALGPESTGLCGLIVKNPWLKLKHALIIMHVSCHVLLNLYLSYLSVLKIKSKHSNKKMKRCQNLRNHLKLIITSNLSFNTDNKMFNVNLHIFCSKK